MSSRSPHEEATIPDREATLELSEGSMSETRAQMPQISWYDDGAATVEQLGFDARYDRRGTLAHGGSSKVHIVRDVRIGRDVAAKLLNVDHCKSPELRTRFIREACLQGQLEHPSIVPVHDLGATASGQLYFTMKRIRGSTLAEVIAKLQDGDPATVQKFTRRKLLTAFNSVCLTIAFAHERGVIHRDLKPGNIMLGDFGETYVLDWGLAKYTGDPEQLPFEGAADVDIKTNAAAVIGTPGYMAPEQIAGQSEQISFEADVYALGAILFELLTLEPLHLAGPSYESLIHSTLQGADARPSVRAPERCVDPELEAICVKATAFVPQDRYPGVRTISEAIERYLDGDRDLSLRQDAAQAHAASARNELQRARHAPPENEEAHRAVAMREIGKALALDAGNESAMRSLTRLLSEPPRQLPREARARLERARVSEARLFHRTGTFACLLVLILLPLFILMGVRSWSFVLSSAAALLLLGGFNWHLARVPLQPPWMKYLGTLCGVAAATLASRIFGPLFLMPSLLLLLVVSSAFGGDRSLRRVTAAASICAIFVNTLLASVGVLAPAYEFSDGRLCILPNVLDFTPAVSICTLLACNAGLMIVGSLVVGGARDRLRSNEERVHVHSWHLDQLIPRPAMGHAGGSGGGVGPSARAS